MEQPDQANPINESPPPPTAGTTYSLIVLFDGTCGLCDSLVNFLLKHDQKKRFLFSPQQSQPARDLMATHKLDPEKINSIVLIDGEHAYIRSSAVLRISTELPDPWPLAGLLVFIPAGLRDMAYDYIARHRKQWFKPRETCRMPTPEERERFIV